MGGMQRIATLVLLTAFSFMLAATFLGAAPASQPVKALVNAHAHNDYEHARPLLDALDSGFCSVEADIHLIDGKFLVAHNRLLVRQDRTLQSLYLDPLRERARGNGGRVYPGGPTVVLLVDFKTNGDILWPALKDLLKTYADILTTWQDGKRQEHAVTIVLTGGYPRATLAREGEQRDTVRYAAGDGLLEEMTGKLLPSAEVVPWVSGEWKKVFTWKGVGPIPPEEKKRMKELAGQAHQQGRTLRFWGAPDNPATWAELQSAGVDWINSDDLKGLRAYLMK